MRTLLALLVITIPAHGAGIDLWDIHIGDAGPIGTANVKKLTITEVGDDWIAVRCQTVPSTFTIVVRGIPTAGLVDDKPWEPKGNFKVEKTEKYKGKTVFVFQAQK